MRRITLIAIAAAALAVLLPAPGSAVKPKAGDWEITTGAPGVNEPPVYIQFEVDRTGKKVKVRHLRTAAPDLVGGCGTALAEKGSVRVRHSRFAYDRSLHSDALGGTLEEEVSGKFVTKKKAKGTFRLRLTLDDSPRICDTGTVPWTARLERK